MKQFESFGLDTSNQSLLCAGARIDLAPRLFAVLRYLVENPGRLVTHDEMLDALWPETYVQPQVLRTYVLELRKILGDDAAKPRFIQTLPKRGYRFVASVSELAASPPSRPAGEGGGLRAEAVVGREEELRFLNEQMDIAATGRRAVVFVTGEAGIGKTALVDWFCRHSESSSAACLGRGQCVQRFGKSEEFYPVVEALSCLLAGPEAGSRRRTMASRAPAWLHTGRSADAGPIAQAASAPQRTIGDLCIALEEMAADRPLILVFEDLHWADDSTLNLISALARRRGEARLMVLATLCPQRESSIEPLRALRLDLLMHRMSVELALRPLSMSAIQALLGCRLAQEAIPPGLCDFVFRRSEGSPLFAIAVLEHLIALGVIVRTGENGGHRWLQSSPFPAMEDGIPDSLARMIELEIERLSCQEQSLLEAASLMSLAFPAWAVAAALDRDGLEVEEACEQLSRRLHFVLRAGQDELPGGARSPFYVFAHGLYREFLYLRQSPALRGRRHIRIAERLGELFAGREASVAREMALHYEAAGDSGRAATTLQATDRHVSQSAG